MCLARMAAVLQAAERRLFRNLGARHRFQGRDAAASGRLLESARLWRQRHASHCRAGRMMQGLAWLALAGMLLIGPATAQTTFTPREESPEEFASGAGRDETF